MATETSIVEGISALTIEKDGDADFGSASKIKEAHKTVIIKLPDMFVSFLANPPMVNPHYEEVKVEAEAWITERLKDEKASKRITKTDFAWFMAIAAPEAPKEEFRTLCDWGNWVFPFDDMFDNGHLRDDPIKSKKTMDSLLSIIRNPDEAETANEGKNVFVEIHDTVWRRVVEGSPKVVQKRFADAMEEYAKGVLGHVGDFSRDKLPSVEEYLRFRRDGVGVTPVLALVQYAHRIDVSEEIFNHKGIQELNRIATDIVIFQNDIQSYAKEQAEGVPHNIVTVLRQSGMTIQEAFNEAGAYLRNCYRDWYLTQADLPLWGEEVAGQVQKYIRALETCVMANLNWGFRSDRYFGKAKEVARKCRTVAVFED